ncbi:MAG: hypothetical protein WCS99_01240 [Limisphaerales bacterium]
MLDGTSHFALPTNELTRRKRQPTTRTVNDILNLRLALRALLAGAAVGF